MPGSEAPLGARNSHQRGRICSERRSFQARRRARTHCCRHRRSHCAGTARRQPILYRWQHLLQGDPSQPLRPRPATEAQRSARWRQTAGLRASTHANAPPSSVFRPRVSKQKYKHRLQSATPKDARDIARRNRAITGSGGNALCPLGDASWLRAPAGSGVFPAPAMSSISPPWCKTSRPWRSVCSRRGPNQRQQSHRPSPARSSSSDERLSKKPSARTKRLFRQDRSRAAVAPALPAPVYPRLLTTYRVDQVGQPSADKRHSRLCFGKRCNVQLGGAPFENRGT
jgi:hypothetical protein